AWRCRCCAQPHTRIYALSLHDALPISSESVRGSLPGTLSPVSSIADSSELHRIHDGVEVEVIAELEEIVAQRGDVHARRYPDGEIGRAHVRAGLHGAVA